FTWIGVTIASALSGSRTSEADGARSRFTTCDTLATACCRSDATEPRRTVQIQENLQLESLRRELLSRCAGDLRHARVEGPAGCGLPCDRRGDNLVEQESHPSRLRRLDGIVGAARPAVVHHRG